MTKQSTLFQETEPTVLAELDLEEAGKLAEAIKAAVEAHCDKIEVAGSIRRQKPKVHDIDFVVVAKSDSDWQRDKRDSEAPEGETKLLRKPAHKSILALPKRTLPSRLLPSKTINLRHSPAHPHRLSRPQHVARRLRNFKRNEAQVQ